MFTIRRSVRPGEHALMDVFPALDEGPAFTAYPLGPAGRRRLARNTRAIVVAREGEWMYVAPHAIPPDADPRWKPVAHAGDAIVMGTEYLRRGRSIDVYLDIHHELLHLVQRANGRELWDEAHEYVDRPTEIEAYRFAVDEARRLGIGDPFLRRYLKVPWVSRKDHLRLLKNVGVERA